MHKNRIQKLSLSSLLRFALEEKFDKFGVSYDDKDAKASTPREIMAGISHEYIDYANILTWQLDILRIN